MEKDFVFLVDRRFRRAAKKEICDALHSPDVTLLYQWSDTAVLSAKSAARIDADALSFVDFAMPVDRIIPKEYVQGEEEDEIRKVAERAEGPFMIEVKRLGAAIKENAKSVEVALGRALEKDGVRMDLDTPKTIIYLLLLKGKTVLGHLPSGGRGIDAFRRSNRTAATTLNRAEFKIMEALEYFRVDLGKIDACLDVGASPGGWTHYLSSMGKRVVAVDAALLDYRALAGKGAKVAVFAKGGSVGQTGGSGITVHELDGFDAEKAKKYDVIHIKERLEAGSMGRISALGPFGLIVIDTNTTPKESAEIACSLSGCLQRKGEIIMTLKLVDWSIKEHVDQVTGILSAKYSGIGFKKLPHNRQELTFHAIKSD